MDTTESKIKKVKVYTTVVKHRVPDAYIFAPSLSHLLRIVHGLAVGAWLFSPQGEALTLKILVKKLVKENLNNGNVMDNKDTE